MDKGKPRRSRKYCRKCGAFMKTMHQMKRSRIQIGLAVTMGVAGILSACERAPYDAQALAQLASVATDDIAKNPEQRGLALAAGASLFNAHCSSCHGADLKGLPDHHTPDLTDNEWIYIGDDLETGGAVHLASDVEKTIQFGIRALPRVTNLPTQQENDAKNFPIKNLADMPAMGPGREYDLTDAEIADVAEYVLQIGHQDHDAAMAVRGKIIFDDEGSCYDCHEPDGTGDSAIGSTNLTKPSVYLYGSRREAILASIKTGRAGVSPAFQGTLKPEEIKALAVYVFSKGGPGTLQLLP